MRRRLINHYLSKIFGYLPFNPLKHISICRRMIKSPYYSSSLHIVFVYPLHSLKFYVIGLVPNAHHTWGASSAVTFRRSQSKIWIIAYMKQNKKNTGRNDLLFNCRPCNFDSLLLILGSQYILFLLFFLFVMQQFEIYMLQS